MKPIFVLLCCLMLSIQSNAQMKLIKKMLSDNADTTRAASFMPIPVFGYSQESGFEFGLGALFAFYADRTDSLNRSSNFSGTASYSTKKTYYFSLLGDAWSKGNLYHAIGEIRFKKMPFNFYGIGNRTRKRDEDLLQEQQVKVQFDLEKKVLKNTYTGISAAFEDFSFEARNPEGSFSTDHSLRGKPGGKVVFAGLSQSYDTRNSNNYPTHGFFGRLTYQYAPDFFGGNNFTGSQVSLNLRNFWSLNKKIVLGAQGFYQTIQSGHAPFYLLPQLGNDEIMRGYYSGRYRDQNLLALQTELRYRYNNRFGAVVFAGTGTVWGRSSFSTDRLKPNLGAGLRYFYDPAKGLSVRLDYGIGGKESNEKRQSGFYVSLAEAF